MTDSSTRPRGAAPLAVGLCAALLTACASTAVTLTPSPQAPVCNRAAAALVLWAPQWRPDQKDVSAREAAAADGLNRFFATSGCFARTELRRTGDLGPTAVAAALAGSASRFDTVLTVGVRELGPVVKLLSSAALVEGGTEVVVQIRAGAPRADVAPREFTIHWRQGGPGVVKGVASLPEDMAAALRAGLQPAAGS